MKDECNECRSYAGANFCAHCGRPTAKGAALESEEVLAEVETEAYHSRSVVGRYDVEAHFDVSPVGGHFLCIRDIFRRVRVCVLPVKEAP